MFMKRSEEIYSTFLMFILFSDVAGDKNNIEKAWNFLQRWGNYRVER